MEKIDKTGPAFTMLKEAGFNVDNSENLDEGINERVVKGFTDFVVDLLSDEYERYREMVMDESDMDLDDAEDAMKKIDSAFKSHMKKFKVKI